jgi:hypothetical protein
LLEDLEIGQVELVLFDGGLGRPFGQRHLVEVENMVVLRKSQVNNGLAKTAAAASDGDFHG